MTHDLPEPLLLWWVAITTFGYPSNHCWYKFRAATAEAAEQYGRRYHDRTRGGRIVKVYVEAD